MWGTVVTNGVAVHVRLGGLNRSNAAELEEFYFGEKKSRVASGATGIDVRCDARTGTFPGRHWEMVRKGERETARRAIYRRLRGVDQDSRGEGGL